MIFDDKQQEEHRAAFVKECRQKAWSAACHADWIAKNLEPMFEAHNKLQAEDEELAAKIKGAELAPDYHTVENRERRKTMQQRRNTIAQQLKTLRENAELGQKSMHGLLQSIDSSLSLAEHAGTWGWKEPEPEV